MDDTVALLVLGNAAAMAGSFQAFSGACLIQNWNLDSCVGRTPRETALLFGSYYPALLLHTLTTTTAAGHGKERERDRERQRETERETWRPRNKARERERNEEREREREREKKAYKKKKRNSVPPRFERNYDSSHTACCGAFRIVGYDKTLKQCTSHGRVCEGRQH